MKIGVKKSDEVSHGNGDSNGQLGKRGPPLVIVAKRNARERRRVQAVNSAFAKLRKTIPVENHRFSNFMIPVFFNNNNNNKYLIRILFKPPPLYDDT